MDYKERYDAWLLSRAGREQRAYDFALTERYAGREAALQGDKLYELEVARATLKKIGRDAMDEFRQNGFDTY